ncbi:MAG: zinc-binding dehydrogenase [Bacteroidota bacterium]
MMQSPITREVYRMSKAGSLSQLRHQTEPLGPPGPGEVQVAIKAIGLNFADTFAIKGLYSATPKGSFIPGLEYAGTVIACGTGVTELKEGDAIMGATRFGAYVTHLNIDARYVQPLPTGWSYEEGAAYLVQGLTAFYALFSLGNLQEGHTVLVHSAAGGVGVLANRFAKQAGAYTIGSVGSTEKLDLLNQEGCGEGIVRRGDFATKLEAALGGRKLDLVLECIGGRIFKESYAAMAPMGRLVAYGAAAFASTGNRPNYLKLAWQYLNRPRLDPLLMMRENKAVLAFNLIWLYDHADMLRQTLDNMQQVDIGKPLVGHTFSFEALPEAIRLFLTGYTMGKVVVVV